jgi:hypothetical protein
LPFRKLGALAGATLALAITCPAVSPVTAIASALPHYRLVDLGEPVRGDFFAVAINDRSHVLLRSVFGGYFLWTSSGTVTLPSNLFAGGLNDRDQVAGDAQLPGNSGSQHATCGAPAPGFRT